VSGITRITRTALDAAAKAKPTGTDGLLSDPKKLGAVGIAVAALPIAVEQIAKRVAPKASDVGEQAKDKLSDVRSGLGHAGDKVTSVGQSAKQVAKGAGVSKLKPRFSERGGLLTKLKPGSSEESDDQGRAAPGHGGSGRRMPIQQSVDVAVPIKVAYNRWTRFEDWPEFMHRFETVEQLDDTTLSFSTKMWGITSRFEAEIVEQRPDQRIEWNVTEGPTHTGVVTFHRLADRLTRIEVSMDVEPRGLLEKMARGMRFTKRAVRADLHRFKALIELQEEAEGGWRGTIEGGKVKRRTERRSSSSGRRRKTQGRNGSGPSSARTGRSRSSS
jgi:uncharacterized membrane protein